MGTNSAEAWIAAATAELRRNNSWTGRIHIHKHLYLAQELGLADPPFEFVLYQYGPYSYDIDTEIAQMELYGYLQKSFPRDGYGPSYSVSAIGSEEAAQLDKGSAKALARVATAIGDADSQTLELRATCLWVERQEGLLEDKLIVNRVQKLKPKYTVERVAGELTAVRKLSKELETPQSA